jgi:hypothetical protein
MNFFEYSSWSPSTFCSSEMVPRVTATSACVSPRWNTADPCVRGSTPTSQETFRNSFGPRPSMRVPPRVISRNTRSRMAPIAAFTWDGVYFGSFSPSGRYSFAIFSLNSSSAVLRAFLPFVR